MEILEDMAQKRVVLAIYYVQQVLSHESQVDHQLDPAYVALL